MVAANAHSCGLVCNFSDLENSEFASNIVKRKQGQTPIYIYIKTSHTCVAGMCHERNEAMIAPLRQEGAIGPHEIANPADKDARHGFIHSLYGRNNACSTAQGGGGSFKDRKRIGEVC